MKKLVLIFALVAIGFGAKAQLKIGNGGNIGIGTNSPFEKLHVASDAKQVILTK